MPRAAADEVTKYARSVAGGRVPACRLHKLACRRHLSDLRAARKRGLSFDVAAAAWAIAFFSHLRHSKGEWAGKPLILEPWQRFIIGSIFGWKTKATGLRRFRFVYIEVPRKNGKSTMSAGVAILLAFFDGEPGAEVYCAATKRDQAKIIWLEAKRMVKGTPPLRKRIGAFASNLSQDSTNSKLEPLGADEDTMDGLNPLAAIIDELHAHKTSGVVDVLETAMDARRQPLQFEITTAGFDQETICYKHHEYTEQVVKGILEDDAWFGFITGTDPKDDWREESTWAKANPNLGVSIKVDGLRKKAKKAENMPASLAAFQQKHLNIWTQVGEVWISVDAWDRCRRKKLTDPKQALAIAAGLDLSSKIDLTALVVLLKFPQEGRSLDVELGEEQGDEKPRPKLSIDFRVECMPFFWLPENALATRAREDRIPYDEWHRAGLLRVTAGNVVDYDRIFREIEDEIAPALGLKGGEIGFDPYNATQFALTLQGAGFRAVEVPQTVRQMSEPTKLLEALVVSRRLRHDGHKLLRWCVSNVSVKEDKKGNLFPFKASKRKRIDGATATIIGLNRLIGQAEEETSGYNERAARGDEEVVRWI